MRRLALLIALTLIASPVRAVGADQLVGTSSSPTNDVSTSHLAAPATLEAARELEEAMRYESRFGEFANRSVAGENDRRVSACASRNEDPKTPASEKKDCIQDMETFQEKVAPVRDALAPAYRRKLAEVVAEIYAKRFSAEELKQISKFYRTPVGMKLAASFPVMDREFAEKNLDLQLDFMIEVLSRLGKDQSTAR